MTDEYQKIKTVGDALEYLATAPWAKQEARTAAEKAERVRKTTLAVLIRQAPIEEKTVQQKETWALTQPEYTRACETYEVARGVMEFHFAQTDAAKCVIEAWRTQRSDKRAAENVR